MWGCPGNEMPIAGRTEFYRNLISEAVLCRFVSTCWQLQRIIKLNNPTSWFQISRKRRFSRLLGQLLVCRKESRPVMWFLWKDLNSKVFFELRLEVNWLSEGFRAKFICSRKFHIIRRVKKVILAFKVQRILACKCFQIKIEMWFILVWMHI